MFKIYSIVHCLTITSEHCFNKLQHADSGVLNDQCCNGVCNPKKYFNLWKCCSFITCNPFFFFFASSWMLQRILVRSRFLVTMSPGLRLWVCNAFMWKFEQPPLTNHDSLSDRLLLEQVSQNILPSLSVTHGNVFPVFAKASRSLSIFLMAFHWTAFRLSFRVLSADLLSPSFSGVSLVSPWPGTAWPGALVTKFNNIFNSLLRNLHNKNSSSKIF